MVNRTRTPDSVSRFQTDGELAETVPANAAAGGVDRGVQPIATTPAGTNPEHNPGASTFGAR